MSDKEIVRGADPVNGELEVGYDSPFELRWHRYELLGRVVLVIVMAAGLAGLLGSGPYSHRTLNSPSGALTVDFEPVARWDTPTQVTLHIRRPAGSGVAELRLDSNFMEPLGLQGTVPLNVAEAARGGGLTVMVATAPDQTEAFVRLHAKPTQIGPIALTVQVGDEPPLRWTQYVLP